MDHKWLKCINGHRGIILALVLCAQGVQAAPPCDPIRFAYTDADIFPYFVGSGAVIPAAPGAAVDLVKEMAATKQCDVLLTRLPTLRLLNSTIQGLQDAQTMTDPPVDVAARIAVPRDAANDVDYSKSMRVRIFVYVLRSDFEKRNEAPNAWLRHRTIGVEFGTFYAESLRKMGYTVEQDAAGSHLGLKKLLAKHVGAIATMGPTLDPYLAVHPELGVMRLEEPISQVHGFVVFSQAYYQEHRDLVEAFWDWIAKHGQKRLESLLQQYLTEQVDPIP
jgi:hypothetical protein